LPIVKAGSINVNYEIDGVGPFVVFVHGHGTNLRFFDDLAAYMKREYAVIRYDQRGYGLTDKSLKPPYSTKIWANDLYQFISALGIKQAVVAGHSMGGRICATFAANHPEMVIGLITLNTTWFGTNPEAADYLENNAVQVEREGMRLALNNPWLQSIRREKVRDSLAQEVLRNDPASYALGTRAVANDFRGGFREDILKAIKCPTMILIGDRDSAPIQGAIKMHSQIIGSRLAVIPASGHCSILERPEISTAVITDFLKEITRSSGNSCLASANVNEGSLRFGSS